MVSRRGLIYLALNRIDAALADLDAAIALGPDFSDTYYGRGRCHEITGDTAEAIAEDR
jgi:hypothetical protein